MSAGQQERLSFARPLLHNPTTLIVNDSTTAVPTATDAQIRKAFRAEIPDTTTLIIEKRISSAQDAAKIIVIDGGKINAVGTHDELLASNGIYKEVYYSQQKGGDNNG